jgi:hypothetical protein
MRRRPRGVGLEQRDHLTMRWHGRSHALLQGRDVAAAQLADAGGLQVPHEEVGEVAREHRRDHLPELIRSAEPEILQVPLHPAEGQRAQPLPAARSGLAPDVAERLAVDPLAAVARVAQGGRGAELEARPVRRKPRLWCKLRHRFDLCLIPSWEMLYQSIIHPPQITLGYDTS